MRHVLYELFCLLVCRLLLLPIGGLEGAPNYSRFVALGTESEKGKGFELAYLLVVVQEGLLLLAMML